MKSEISVLILRYLCVNHEVDEKQVILPFPAVPRVSCLHINLDKFQNYHRAYHCSLYNLWKNRSPYLAQGQCCLLPPSSLPCLESWSSLLAVPHTLITLLIFYVWDPASPPSIQAILQPPFLCPWRSSYWW